MDDVKRRGVEMSTLPEGIVRIHNKEYQTVAYRIKTFRDEHPDWSIATEVISADENKVLVKAAIANPAGQIISTGYAEEVRDATAINRTSAVEVAETSAVGRALAFYGLAGTEIASADEVAGAIAQQKIEESKKYLIAHNDAWKRHEHSIHCIKAFVDEGNLSAAWEAWNEIPEDDQRALKIAPTKGGWMRKEDKEALTEAAKNDFDPELGVYKSIAERNENG